MRLNTKWLSGQCKDFSFYSEEDWKLLGDFDQRSNTFCSNRKALAIMLLLAFGGANVEAESQ